ncbi:hypothetical protein V6O07_10290, partial [Arthrospira platensis SPKY2]
MLSAITGIDWAVYVIDSAIAMGMPRAEIMSEFMCDNQTILGNTAHYFNLPAQVSAQTEVPVRHQMITK